MSQKKDWAICPHTSKLVVHQDGYLFTATNLVAMSSGRYAVNEAGQVLYANRAGTYWRVLRYGGLSGRCDRHKLSRALRLLPLPE